MNTEDFLRELNLIVGRWYRVTFASGCACYSSFEGRLHHETMDEEEKERWLHFDPEKLPPGSMYSVLADLVTQIEEISHD